MSSADFRRLDAAAGRLRAQRDQARRELAELRAVVVFGPVDQYYVPGQTVRWGFPATRKVLEFTVGEALSAGDQVAVDPATGLLVRAPTSALDGPEQASHPTDATEPEMTGA